MFGKRKKAGQSIDPANLDWGDVTPDVYSETSSQVTCVSAHYHLNQNARALSRIYSSGRVIWYTKHIPKNISYELILDIRGQDEIEFEFDLQKEWADNVRQKLAVGCPDASVEINCLA